MLSHTPTMQSRQFVDKKRDFIRREQNGIGHAVEVTLQLNELNAFFSRRVLAHPTIWKSHTPCPPFFSRRMSHAFASFLPSDVPRPSARFFSQHPMRWVTTAISRASVSVTPKSTLSTFPSKKELSSLQYHVHTRNTHAHTSAAFLRC